MIQDGSMCARLATGLPARQVFLTAGAIKDNESANPWVRMRILIVEDETVVAMWLADMVQDLGHAVVGTTASHAAAAAAAEASRPDMALVDINLGRGGNGIEAALELRRRFDLPSVFLSAYLASPDVREQAQAAQPFGFVPKPCTGRDISAALGQAATRLSSR